MTPKVDTFEHNIIEEIKRKDASLTQISAASNDVGNITVVETKKRPIVIIAAGVVALLCLIGGGALAYFYFTDPLLPPSAAPVKVSPADVPKKIALLGNISPTLDEEIGRNVIKVEKKNEGYIITINDYSAVFSYMTRNEGDYIGELGASFSPSVASSTLGSTAAPTSSSTLKVLPLIITTASSAPVVTSTTTKIATSTQPKVTTGATSTIITSTTTKATSTPKTPPTSKKVIKSTTSKTTLTQSTTTLVQTTSTATSSVPAPISIPLEEAPLSLFSDVTISNQNMRVWKNGTKVVVYAFVSTNTILISNSTEGILSLKNAILH